MVNLNDMRKQYNIAELNRSDLLESPTAMFRDWFGKVENLDNIEVNAMTLSTSSKIGEPSSRIVLLKSYDENGFVFYTNYNSEKGKQIEQNPYGSLTFHWNQLERQIRIRGKIRKISRAQSEKYFNSRPRLSQVSVLASKQSDVLRNRMELEERFIEIEKKYEGKKIPCPDYWGGYCLEHRKVEFWQGRRDRMHDRFAYTKHGTTWQTERLSP
jgi:pyridoxamine 5'-phosphate oxidase|tara:strand:+ start:248 stop:886 length:639 start_codon:yes stop_codon:yes gene_type:complete